MIQPLLVSLISFWLSHPFHTSITTCEYNAETDNLEISLRVFSDDLEQAIGHPLENMKPDTRIEKDSAVQKYISRNFGFKAQNVDLSPIYIGRETEYDITYLYLEIPSFPEQEKRYEIRQSILFDQFDDQSNIVHLKIGDRQKSLFFTRGENFKALVFP